MVTMRLVFFTLASHRVHVQRTQGAQIDHFGVDTVLGQLLGGFQRLTDRDGVSDDGDILAGAHDARLADGQHEIVQLGHRKAFAVNDFIFQEDDRTADRGWRP